MRISSLLSLAMLCALLMLSAPAFAQVEVTAGASQQAMLRSDDPALAANKRLVFDFWRIVLDAHRVDQAGKYMVEDYVQHNPNVPTGRAAFVGYFGSMDPLPVAPKIKAEIVSITAERDLVTMAHVVRYPDPSDASKTYTTTWFDMFRIEGGKIVEHWDSALKHAR